MENEASDIVKDFFKWVPPKFSADAVTSKLFHDTVGSDLNNRYPVDTAYCSRFCRYLLDTLEKDEALAPDDRDELIEELYNKIGILYSSGKTCDAYRYLGYSNLHRESNDNSLFPGLISSALMIQNCPCRCGKLGP